ncbi:MAG: uroporphyrinogen-III synthase [Brevundimonas sp.]|uniref:Uroporphyrinogen-III synthase n=1 Tax=Brevundimonas albigilva TaxID=1312364 RepID=A0ABY4SPI0_9CAUL|nr:MULTISPECIES: uroporphyrinogen-III synthase [Brevundimonas]PZU59723.1 MAG: uroporphyrinogen-III synthase [Brevundimonas sp.]URI14590.1 uroporphyrinogen-III synthase [Brevundimonas albigilva]
MTSRAPRVWITRAEPGAARTAARLLALGMEPVVRPLLAIQTLSPELPDLDAFAALAFTSVNGVAAFAGLSARRDRPVFAVGDATAQAARDAGFARVDSADGDLAALARRIAAGAAGPVLAAVAETPVGDLAAAVRRAGGGATVGVGVQAVAVYRARSTGAAPPDLFDAVLVHSPRAGRALANAGGAVFATAVIAAISPAAAAPLQALGLSPAVAPAPREDALLDVLQAALGKRDPRV